MRSPASLTRDRWCRKRRLRLSDPRSQVTVGPLSAYMFYLSTFALSTEPGAVRDDRDRHAAEDDARLLREIETTVRRLTRESLLSGREHQAGIAAATVGILVRAGRDNEAYVALRITGSV